MTLMIRYATDSGSILPSSYGLHHNQSTSLSMKGFLTAFDMRDNPYIRKRLKILCEASRHQGINLGVLTTNDQSHSLNTLPLACWDLSLQEQPEAFALKIPSMPNPLSARVLSKGYKLGMLESRLRQVKFIRPYSLILSTYLCLWYSSVP
jgi:hypothetical protein